MHTTPNAKLLTNACEVIKYGLDVVMPADYNFEWEYFYPGINYSSIKICTKFKPLDWDSFDGWVVDAWGVQSLLSRFRQYSDVYRGIEVSYAEEICYLVDNIEDFAEELGLEI